MSRIPFFAILAVAMPASIHGAPAPHAGDVHFSANPVAFATSPQDYRQDGRHDEAIRRAFRDSLRRSPSDRELRQYRDLMDQGWSERDVRETLRNDASSRGQSNGRSGDQRSATDSRSRSGRGGDPEQIVRRAYQDILQREPDEAGLRLYRGRIVDERWSEQDVREALRTSPEFRDKNAMTRQKAEEVVRRAYRSTLNRDPDAGAQGYVDKVFRERWTEQQVAGELRKSAEYRNKIR